MILGLDHVSVLVSDMARASWFYEAVLGLSRVARHEMGFEWVWLSLGGHQTLHLMRLPNPDADAIRPSHAGRDRHIALRVQSLSEVETRLSQANVAFTRSMSGRNSIFCRDTDGNGVELMEVLTLSVI